MGYAILRFSKLSSSGITGSAEHTFRERPTKNADANRTHLNTGNGPQNALDVLRAIDNRIEATCTRKPRTDSPRCIEVLITASPDLTIDYEKYLREGEEWLQKQFGKENVICTNYQRDEKTPHLVAYITPIYTNPKSGAVTLSSKEWLGGKEKLQNLQTTFWEEVGQKNGLERGVKGSDCEHVRTTEYQAIKRKEFNEISKKYPNTNQLPTPPETRLGYVPVGDYQKVREIALKLNKANNNLKNEIVDAKATAAATMQTIRRIKEDSELRQIHPQLKKEIKVTNLTLNNAQSQLAAMGEGLFDLVEIKGLDGERKVRQRKITIEKLPNLISYLKHQNAEGENIYIRRSNKTADDQPIEHDNITIDDIDEENLKGLQEEFPPALVIETSPKNYQAVVRLESSKPYGVRKAIARALAERYQADNASADGQHLIRLAGFTNRKLKHKRLDGYYPYVKLIKTASHGKTIGKKLTETLMEWAETFMPAAINRLLAMSPLKRGDRIIRLTQSEQDFGKACEMIRRGETDEQIEKYLIENSADLSKRHKNVSDYLKRTIQNARISVTNANTEEHTPRPAIAALREKKSSHDNEPSFG
jgi:uncharacterized protein YeeX (DUF496 family)